MSTVQRYYLTVDDLPNARGPTDSLSFHGASAELLAAQLQGALRESKLWLGWRAMQPDPDDVDPNLGAIDPDAVVTAHQADLHVEVEVVTRLPHSILQHRLTLLIGRHWKLHDVQSV